MSISLRFCGLVPALSLMLAGCVSATVPASRNTAAVASVRAADELGAARNSRAGLHLRLAREELQLARRLTADGEPARANLMFQRSRMDAELAIAITRETTAVEQARVFEERAREMRAGAR